MKKFLCFGAAFLLIAAGGVWATGSSQKSTSTAVAASNLNTPGTFPVVKTKETITVMRSVDNITDSMDNNLFTKYYEDKTNVHVNWMLAPKEQYQERVNLALMSGDNIDFIQGAAGDRNVLQRYANDKVVLALQDYINNDTANIKKNFDTTPLWRQAVTMSDGSIYAVPILNECLHCAYYGKMWVNKEFLKNVGLSIPKTTEEFRQMLIAFKTKDANGNGDPNDEIPFAASYDDDTFSTKVDTYLISAFVYDDGLNRLYLENGKVTAAFQQPDFQEGLRYLRRLYSEGLISPDSFTLNWNSRNQLNSQKYESIIGAVPAEHHGGLGNRSAGQPARWIDYEPIPPLTGPKGLQTARYDYYGKLGAGDSVIPATSKRAPLVMRWLDWFYTDEGAVWLEWGMKDINWADADPGATGLDSGPATYKLLDTTNDPRVQGVGYNWGQGIPNMRTAALRAKLQTPFDYLVPDGSGVERMLHVKTLENYAPYGWPAEKQIPPLTYGDNATELALLRTNINTYVDESIAKFVTGTMDVERDWTAFQNNLRSLNIDRYLQLIQNAYNASAFAKK